MEKQSPFHSDAEIAEFLAKYLKKAELPKPSNRLKPVRRPRRAYVTDLRRRGR